MWREGAVQTRRAAGAGQARRDSVPGVSYRRCVMRRLRRSALALALGLAAAPAAAAPTDGVAVARAHVRVPGGSEAAGSVFFLPADDEAGAVAVGTAHSFDLDKLVQGGEVEFRLGVGGERVAVSSRFLAPPGRAFHEPGAGLRDDFVIFALDLRPRDVVVLEPAAQVPRKGDRVRILGIPSDGRALQDQVFGTIARVGEERIEVDLDALGDLRGWGGAPVLDAGSGRVLGLLQAAWPSADRLRVGVAPLDGVLAALRRPLDGGLGRPFAAFAHPAPGGGAGPPDPADAARAGAPRPGAAGPGEPGAPPRAPRAAQPTTDLRIEIEYPAEEAIVVDAAGAFMAGRAFALQGDFKRFDIMIVVDTSGSTSAPTGVDVDGNGVVGSPRLGAIGGILDLGSTDPADSILAAEVAAARKLLMGLDPRNTRVGLVTFAGEPLDGGTGFFGRVQVRQSAFTEEPLTADYARLEKSLRRVRERGPRGMTHMAAGVDQATIELLGLSGALSKPDPSSEKVVLFFTDGEPTLPYTGFTAENVRAVLRAAQRAQRAGVRIHSFAIGPEALAGPIATVEMASITDGEFTPVRHPGLLVNLIDAVSFANIEEIRVRNATLDQPAFEVRNRADGSWGALVPVEAGRNRLEVTARSSDGAEAQGAVTVHYAPGAAPTYVPADLVPRRNELLEARLVELKRGRLDAEREQVEQARRELALEIERERSAASEAAERQRKELNLELGSPTP